MEIFGLNQFSLPEIQHPLVYIGLLLLLSYAGGKVASYLKAPRISGYIVIGMLISPSVLGLFHERVVKEDLALITDIALAIIAFSIGGSLRMSKLRKLGSHILWITLTEAFGAFLLTTTVLTIFFLSDLWIKGASAFFLHLLFSYGVRNWCDQRSHSTGSHPGNHS